MTSETQKTPFPESIWVFIAKIVLISVCVMGYTWHLIDGTARVAVACAVIAASGVALFFTRMRLRIAWCFAVSAIVGAIGIAGCGLTLDAYGAYDVASTIRISRYWYYSALVFSLVLAMRSLALRYRTWRIAEAVFFLGTLVYLLFGHRDFNLTRPREIADYLYGNGYNPIDVYRSLGVASAILSFVILLARAHIGRAVYSFAVLIILMLFAAGNIGSAKLSPDIVDPLGLRSPDADNDDGKSDDDDQEDGGEDENDGDQDDDKEGSASDGENGNNKNSSNNSGNSSSNDPVPVAVAVFYDEYAPPDGILYFRQSVLSRYDGNHLVASTADNDVISSLPPGGAAEAEHVQNAALHSKISTSMFLMQSHAQPPQLAMGQRVFAIQNPDPGVFVSVYGVESLGMTVDVTRLIGRSSVPAGWPDEKREHYLKTPDDPRYRALSDIIVRQIDPRFAGDDIVKALYIKSWLEKEGFYTMKTRHIDKSDPTASFLFGSLRGYCVHFAHAAALLLRSQGIAARVAVGYAVDNRLRGTNSAVLILGNQAHAWPEIYVDGAGWVTFDIYPENSDEPPRAFVDRELESLFGELARDDKSGGKAPEATQKTFEFPARDLILAFLSLVIIALAALYARKIVIICMGLTKLSGKTAYRGARAVFFVWAMYGHSARRYPSFDAFIAALPGDQSATAKVYQTAIAARFGGAPDAEFLRNSASAVKAAFAEARQNTPAWRRILGWLNPVVLM